MDIYDSGEWPELKGKQRVASFWGLIILLLLLSLLENTVFMRDMARMGTAVHFLLKAIDLLKWLLL